MDTHKIAARDDSVAAVIVTYADRAVYCIAAVVSARDAGVDAIVVVNNGATSDSRRRIGEALATYDSVDILDLAANEGSAIGFGRGIEHALARFDVGAVWLLDDDNAPEPNALRTLIASREALRSRTGHHEVNVTSLRPGRARHAMLAAGASLAATYPSRGSYADFHVWDAARKLLKIAARRRSAASQASAQRHIAIPYGPYGGLLLSRSVVSRFGVPDPALDTYEDDSEYTRRMIVGGVTLTLVTDSVVHDQEESWYVEARGHTPFGRHLNASSERRVYLTIRNRLVFERQYWRGFPGVMTANGVVFHVLLTVAAASSGQRKRRDVIRTATRDARRLHRSRVA